MGLEQMDAELDEVERQLSEHQEDVTESHSAPEQPDVQSKAEVPAATAQQETARRTVERAEEDHAEEVPLVPLLQQLLAARQSDYAQRLQQEQEMQQQLLLRRRQQQRQQRQQQRQRRQQQQHDPASHFCRRPASAPAATWHGRSFGGQPALHDPWPMHCGQLNSAPAGHCYTPYSYGHGVDVVPAAAAMRPVRHTLLY